MKKNPTEFIVILLIIAIVISLVTMFSSCTKNYLDRQMLSYKVTGNCTLSYYSNTEHKTEYVSVGGGSYCGEWTYQEPIHSGDTLQFLLLCSYYEEPHVTIYLGTSPLFEGSPDSTGILYLYRKFHDEDFRLQKAR